MGSLKGSRLKLSVTRIANPSIDFQVLCLLLDKLYLFYCLTFKESLLIKGIFILGSLDSCLDSISFFVEFVYIVSEFMDRCIIFRPLTAVSPLAL